MQFPSRRARVALLAGVGAIAVAAPASADPTDTFDAASGKLTIGYADAENVELTVDAGKVAVNGTATTTDADAVKSLEVRENAAGTEVNTIDLSAVSAADFPLLTGTLVRAEGGDDTLIWRNGEGTDDMFGGDGIDLIENFGADTGSATVDEVYTAEAVDGGGFKFSRLPNPAVAAPGGGSFALNVKGAEKYTNHLLGGNDKF